MSVLGCNHVIGEIKWSPICGYHSSAIFGSCSCLLNGEISTVLHLMGVCQRAAAVQKRLCCFPVTPCWTEELSVSMATVSPVEPKQQYLQQKLCRTTSGRIRSGSWRSYFGYLGLKSVLCFFCIVITGISMNLSPSWITCTKDRLI